MTGTNSILNDLIELSHRLGEESRGYVIVGEGNTSARADDATFWVKASGANLRTIDEHGLVRIDLHRAMELLDTAQNDAEVQRGLNAAKCDPTVTARPSIETFLHAIALTEGGAHFVGHTHPVAVNAILCSQRADALHGHLFPDAIVVCGVAPVLVPYCDPGLTLARTVRDALRHNIAVHGERPKVIYLQNHGMLALGQTPSQVENITAMAVKNAQILIQTFLLGGPRFLDEREVARIHTRPDEIARGELFQGK